jgi:hypothetical protein
MAKRKLGMDDEGARPHIETAAVPHRLGDAERNGNQIRDERGPEPERNRHRHLLDDEIDDRAVTEEALAEIEHQEVAHHLQEALKRWLVETELVLQFLDELRGNALSAAVLALA